MDEEPGQPAWTLSRCVIEASFVSMLILLLLDGFAWIVGPIA
jgi:cycloeucalenol cycloisomerase